MHLTDMSPNSLQNILIPLLAEFLYPTAIARWAHFYLLKVSSKKGKDENHSRCLEQRVEMVKGTIFCHPVPQLLDNLGYLVVCVPDTKATKIVAFLVDCGDAQATHNIILDIQDLHYRDHTIELQAILATHKHHDHTAGIKNMLEDEIFGQAIAHIYGGAVERVPHCTTMVANGDKLHLPQLEGNDMNKYIEVEVVATPGHTRGSVTYVMRSKVGDPVSFCFTGDTIFSGGGGVPFEADIQTQSDLKHANKTTASFVRASAGSNAIERCFAEVMVRAIGDLQVKNHVLIFPGHEYTAELVNRQFLPSAGETSNWNKMPPSVFFETASHLFISQHRRTIPKDGKLLTIPTPLSRELVINPILRKMRRRGEDVIKALQLWHRVFERPDSNGATIQETNLTTRGKTAATDDIWTLDVNDVSRSVFTTVYTADLESLIQGLAHGKFDRENTLQELKNLKTKLDEPLIGRRPIPGTFPTEKVMYQAILGFCLLGSPPSALTISDSRLMNLNAPVNPSREDKILISKTRIVAVLQALALIKGGEGSKVVEMVHSLWAQASIGTQGSAGIDTEDQQIADEIELGTLKWMLFGGGVNEGHPSSLLLCLPCKSTPNAPLREHPIHKLTSMRKTSGELIKHDILSCPLCRDATGCANVKDLGKISRMDAPASLLELSTPTTSVGVDNITSNSNGRPVNDEYKKPIKLVKENSTSLDGPWRRSKPSESISNGPWDENDDVFESCGYEVEIAKSSYPL